MFLHDDVDFSRVTSVYKGSNVLKKIGANPRTFVKKSLIQYLHNLFFLTVIALFYFPTTTMLWLELIFMIRK